MFIIVIVDLSISPRWYTNMLYEFVCVCLLERTLPLSVFVAAAVASYPPPLVAVVQAMTYCAAQIRKQTLYECQRIRTNSAWLRLRLRLRLAASLTYIFPTGGGCSWGAVAATAAGACAQGRSLDEGASREQHRPGQTFQPLVKLSSPSAATSVESTRTTAASWWWHVVAKRFFLFYDFHFWYWKRSAALSSAVAEIVVKRSFNEPHDFNALLLSAMPQHFGHVINFASPWPVKASLRDANLAAISSGKCCSTVSIVVVFLAVAMAVALSRPAWLRASFILCLDSHVYWNFVLRYLL